MKKKIKPTTFNVKIKDNVEVVYTDLIHQEFEEIHIQFNMVLFYKKHVIAVSFDSILKHQRSKKEIEKLCKKFSEMHKNRINEMDAIL